MVWSALAHLFTVLLALIGRRRRSDQEKDLEILILLHQLNMLVRKQKNPIKATRAEKLILAVLAASLKARTGRPNPALPAGNRVTVAPSLGPPQVDLSAQKHRWTTPNRAGSRSPDRAAGQGE